MSTTFEVLVPKKVGSGFVKVPFGHHDNPGLTRIAFATYDIFGLDGSLSFQCGSRVCGDEGLRKAFEAKVLPMLQSHYGWSTREVDQQEYWALNPVPHTPGFGSIFG